MTTDQNKAIARRLAEEGFEKNNWSVVSEIMSPTFIEHVPAQPGYPKGLEGLRQWLTAFRTAFPDLHYTTDDAIAEGDKVVQRVTGQGTMKGAFAGMPATGKKATWSEIHISRFKDGKVVEHWATVDQMGMLQQLGVVPTPAQTPA